MRECAVHGKCAGMPCDIRVHSRHARMAAEAGGEECAWIEWGTGMQPGGSVGAGAEHPRPLKEGCSTAACRAHAPHEAPSLALEAFRHAGKEVKSQGVMLA